MGNNTVPPLAIIFMDYIEEMILKNSSGKILLWKRYIDDIFFVSSLDFDYLLQLSNSVSPHIQFTLEKPNNNQIAFLDAAVNTMTINFNINFT